MQEILSNIISILTGDSTLTAIIPATSIMVGPIDIVTEKQSELLLPQLNVHMVSEVSRTVPSNTRDTIIQIDIWSRNNQLEVSNVYERIITLLNYQSPTINTAKVFWYRLESSNDLYESDRRIFHRAMSFRVWSIKP